MYVDVNDTIFLVTGSQRVPEIKDRPFAYQLKEAIDAQGQNNFQKGIVVSDLWYLDNELLHVCATILIGGPGVNDATLELYEHLLLYWTANNQAFIHWRQEENNQAAIWGLDQRGTELALRYFEQKLLNAFLHKAWNFLKCNPPN